MDQMSIDELRKEAVLKASLAQSGRTRIAYLELANFYADKLLGQSAATKTDIGLAA